MSVTQSAPSPPYTPTVQQQVGPYVCGYVHLQ